MKRSRLPSIAFDKMDAQSVGPCVGDTLAIIGGVLWVSSELIGMSRLKSNGNIQLALEILMKAFPKK